MHLGHQKNYWMVSQTDADLTRRWESRTVRIEATPQRLTIDLERTAILVIDMQNDFCSPGGWLHSIGADIAPAQSPVLPLSHLLPQLRAAHVPVLWVNWGNRADRLNLSPSILHVYNPNGDGSGLGDIVPGGNSRTLEKGSWGASVVSDLSIAPQDIQIDKYRMSGFWDTPLDSVLRNLATTTLLFAGVNADQCVMATLQDANSLGYDCILLEDCTATTSPDFCMEATLYNVRQCFGFVSQSQHVLQGIADMTLRPPAHEGE